MMIKNLTRVTDLETNENWRVDKRTRGHDMPNVLPVQPTKTWVLILSNESGHRRFVPELRFWEFFKPFEAQSN